MRHAGGMKMVDFKPGWDSLNWCQDVKSKMSFFSEIPKYSKKENTWRFYLYRGLLICKRRANLIFQVLPDYVWFLWTFALKSQNDSSCSYRLQFGHWNTMSSCNCPDWQKHHWSCKHFLAIYQHFPEWGWEAMSPSYSSSPYFQIDCNVINPSISSGASASQTEQSETSIVSHQEIQQTELNKNQEDGVAETPAVATDSAAVPQHSAFRVQSMGRCCRELLKEIQDLTYLCANEVAFQSLQQNLQKALTSFRPQVPSENGIFMEVNCPAKEKIQSKLKTKPIGSSSTEGPKKVC